MSHELNAASNCFVAMWDEIVVGFTAVLPFPNGSIQNGFRGHRTVILPDYQGLGIGVRLSDFMGALHKAEGKRYYSRTVHPRMIQYRDNSPNWRITSSDRKLVTKLTGVPAWQYDTTRVAASHEYIGPPLATNKPITTESTRMNMMETT